MKSTLLENVGAKKAFGVLESCVLVNAQMRQCSVVLKRTVWLERF